MPSHIAAPSLPATPEVMHAQLSHLVVVAELTAKRVERIEREQEDARTERRALDRLARTLSTAALELSVSRALALVVPPARQLAVVGVAAFLGGMFAQLLVRALVTRG